MGLVSGGPSRPATLAALLCAAALTLTACGSDDDSSSSAGEKTTAASDGGAVVVAAKEKVAEASKLNTEFPPPGPAVEDARSKLSGKTIWYIPITARLPFFQIEERTIKSALGEIGVKVRTCDAKVNPSSASACLTQAANANAAGIIADAMPFEFAEQAFTAVVKKKIPVVLSQLALPIPTDGDFGKYMATVDGSEDRTQRNAAQLIIADSDGKANIVMNNATDTPSSKIASAAFRDEIEKNCPDCKVKSFDSIQTSPNLAQATSSTLLSTPGADYLYVPYEAGGGTAFLQGLRQSGTKVKFVGSAGEPAGLARVAAGTQVADSGADPVHLAWNAVDQIVRLASGAPAVDHTTITRLFTKDNVPEKADLVSWESGSHYSDGGYKDMYLGLWGAKQ